MLAVREVPGRRQHRRLVHKGPQVVRDLDRAERAQPDSLVAPAFPHAGDDGARDHLTWPVYTVDAVDAYLEAAVLEARHTAVPRATGADVCRAPTGADVCRAPTGAAECLPSAAQCCSVLPLSGRGVRAIMD